MDPVALLLGVAGCSAVLLAAVMLLNRDENAKAVTQRPDHGFKWWVDVWWPEEQQASPQQAKQPQPVQPQKRPPQPAGQTSPTRNIVSVPTQPNGSHLVECSINGVKFQAVVDTGAAKCLIDLDVARAAGINVRSLQRSRGTQADGSIMSLRETVVDWTVGGKLEAKAVQTSIIEKNGVGALLGMTAIRQFNISMPDGQMIELEER